MTPFVYEWDLLARQLSQTHRAAVQNELAARGLSEIGHPMLLTILKSHQNGGGDGRCQAQRDLAELLHISPAAVANSLKSLEKSGYIRREPGSDARRNQVALTPKGMEAVDNCEQVFASVDLRALDGFSEEEEELLVTFFRRILTNLRGETPATAQAKEES